MKSKLLFLSTIVSACALSFTAHAADSRHPDMPQGGQKCNPGSPDCPNKIESVADTTNTHSAKKLMTDSVEKFTGTVKSVKRERYPNGKLFVSVILETQNGDKTIMVGPASYVDQSKVKLQTGDKITVKGYSVTGNGQETIMAQSIDKSGNVLQLLDDNRQPLWQNGNGNGHNGH